MLRLVPRVYKESEGRVGKRLKRKIVEQRAYARALPNAAGAKPGGINTTTEITIFY